jgi:hypothetical protein
MKPDGRSIHIEKGAFNLEEEALRASGIQEKGRIVHRKNQLKSLIRKFIDDISPTLPSSSRAEALFHRLWEEKPARYQSRGHYTLNDVIDAQITKGNHPVGNCLGLTLLYNCLLRRLGIMAGSLHLEDAFGKGPHVLTLLTTGGATIDVENSLPAGYDYKGHLDNPSRLRWGDQELVADIHLTNGNKAFEKGDWVEALRQYDAAVRLNPHYEKTHLNRAMVLDIMETDKNAR